MSTTSTGSAAPTATGTAHRRLAAVAALCLVVGAALVIGTGTGTGTALTGAAANLVGISGLHVLVLVLLHQRLQARAVHSLMDMSSGAAVSLAIVALLLLVPLRRATGLDAGAVLLLAPVAVGQTTLALAVTAVLLVRAPHDTRQVAVGVAAAAALAAEYLSLGHLLAGWDALGAEACLRAVAVLAVVAAVTALRGPGPQEPVREDAHVLVVGPAIMTTVSCAVVLLAHARGAPLTVVVAAVAAVMVSAVKSFVVYQRITVLNLSHEQARTDDLTGLGNRRALMAHLAAAEGPLALALLDLDRFKAVNDELGHEAGDDLLRQVAHRLRTMARPGDLVGRQGGDEFAVVLTGATTDAAAHRAREMVAALRQPFVLHPRTRQEDARPGTTGTTGSPTGPGGPGGRDGAGGSARAVGAVVGVGASIGVASMPADAGDVEQLLRAADAAMYRAKRSGGGVRTHGETEARDTPAGPGGVPGAGTAGDGVTAPAAG